MRSLVASLILLVPLAGDAQQYRDGTPHFWPDEATPAPGHELEAPEELAGFRFGWSPREANRACERMGHRWSGGQPLSVCSGTARDPGFEAKVRLRFCDDHLCEVVAVVGDDTIAAYGQLIRVMSRAFGPEEMRRVRAEDACQAQLRQGQSDGCHEVSARHYWSAGGFELFVGLEIPQGHGLKVAFRAPARLQELSATSD